MKRKVLREFRVQVSPVSISGDVLLSTALLMHGSDRDFVGKDVFITREDLETLGTQELVERYARLVTDHYEARGFPLLPPDRLILQSAIGGLLP